MYTLEIDDIQPNADFDRARYLGTSIERIEPQSDTDSGETLRYRGEAQVQLLNVRSIRYPRKRGKIIYPTVLGYNYSKKQPS